VVDIAIIGGSGLTKLKDLQITRKVVMRTPYGEPSAPMVYGMLGEQEVAFLPRHGPRHTIPPHEVNYRANLWALRDAGIRRVIAIAAVGGIGPGYLEPGTMVLPDQIIDYTYGRPNTFFTGADKKVFHIDFSVPYCEALRQSLYEAAVAAGHELVFGGTYGATQGPRFETAAEIARMERDGASIVGMTGMPEAALARELELCYACLALVVNPAAGKSAAPISLQEINANLKDGMKRVRALLQAAIRACIATGIDQQQ
jgi:5'-methylthioinosine phosphorylase